MSAREIIWFFEPFNSDVYLDILKNDCRAKGHPKEPGAYVVDNLPFYEPLEAEEFVIIVGFNKVPLAGILIDVLANHPEFVSDEMLIFWTIEQEVLLETTIGEKRGKTIKIDAAKRDRCRELAQTPFLML